MSAAVGSAMGCNGQRSSSPEVQQDTGALLLMVFFHTCETVHKQVRSKRPRNIPDLACVPLMLCILLGVPPRLGSPMAGLSCRARLHFLHGLAVCRGQSQ